jgi:transcriptional regulator with XRE-family HTH domain
LYEADPEYRSRLTAKRRAEDKTFGACLRRLRLQRGLRQSDFGEVTAKTIARIERGETDAPHGRTLSLIARHLQVEPKDIASF